MKKPAYLCDFIRIYFDDHLVCRRNLSRCTINSYRDALKLFLQSLSSQINKPIMHLTIQDVREARVVEFLEHLESERKNTIQTRNHRLSALRRFFGFIALKEPLLGDYCRRVTDLPAKRGAMLPEVHYLQKQEIQALLDAVDTRTSSGRRDYAVLLFLYNTGARAQEVSDLRQSWLSLEKPAKVRIVGKGKKQRTCPLWNSTVQVLQRLIAETPATVGIEAAVFINRMGQPISRFGIANILDKYRIKASLKITSLKNVTVTPHTIRHTTAMHLLNSGVDINVIRGWLGHANLSTTHRYAEIDFKTKQKALNVCKPSLHQAARTAWQIKPDIIEWLESL